ncbi:hypothetical protein [Thalassolituus sp.]|uniref:hypothetical protein n=1 Tax=Thalassolituus sp. TaxID=2030822 RepID=UPI002630F3DE|nr:hypothetical protein [Thalassolituus sp.]
MTKKEFWKRLGRERKEAIANHVGTSTGYLRQVFMYDKKTGAKRARILAAETDGLFGAHEFCPDAFSESDSLSIDSHKTDAA